MDAQNVQLTKTDSRNNRLSLILGITLWFADLNTVYALPSLACEWNWFPFTIAGIPGLLIVEAAISIVSLLLMAYLIYLPWRNWRKLQTQKPADNPHLLADTENDRGSLVAFIAMMANSFFFLFILATFVPILMLKVCVTG